MDLISAPHLSDLLGDLTGDRPPLYAALAARLRLLISDGRLPIGVRLPAERDLAKELHVSRSTVAAAYGRLREDGWAGARQGSGTWTRLPAGPTPTAWLPGPLEPGVLDLSHAAPGAPPEVSAAFAAALDDLPRFLPGHGYHPQGLTELRARIADRYTAQGLPTTPEQILVTSGALHGVAAALSALVTRGSKVLVEHPTYPNALDAISAYGGRPVPVATDAYAPDEVVSNLLRSARSTEPAAAYLMPHFSNPSGTLLDDEQQYRLASGLGRQGVIAIVDETVRELALDVPAPMPFPADATSATVITAGSMSKTVWGGLRVGWVRTEPELVRRLAGLAGHTGISGPVIDQLAAARLLDDLDSLLAVRRAALTAQRDALVAAVREQLPDWSARVPAGGLVLWCTTPGLSSSALVAAAVERNLMLAAGPRFGTGHAFDDRLRLPYTQPVAELRRGITLLAEVVAEVPLRRRLAGLSELVV